MSESRRKVLTHMAAGMVGAAAAGRVVAEAQASGAAPQVTPVAGTPPAFGTTPPAGPEVNAATFAEAERPIRVEMTAAGRRQAAGESATAAGAASGRRQTADGSTRGGPPAAAARASRPRQTAGKQASARASRGPRAWRRLAGC